ncbi:TetR/AcrR family transcriptional regulator [Litorisediminicola beolgyonensis]|uniref:TetR/AcrR family transcriptional regulator n=1 Tax=Litorisediminicola beolgyonensis TaxID=1173614 RepID=A0ABW3ZHM1_9RHOB
MTRAPQARRQRTHDRLIAAAREIAAAEGYAAMRVEEVVLRAGVAKGTFFSHFADKDALLAVLIGEDLAQAMVEIARAPVPTTARGIADALSPLISVMSAERTVFDVVLRYSGAAAIEEIGPIAQNFLDQIHLLAGWISPLQGHTLRGDVPAELLAEGVQAFLIQSIAMSYCAVEGQVDRSERLRGYLEVWLALR